MDFMIPSIVGRVAERLIVAMGAILSLWCGYKLFFVAVNDVSKAELSGHGIKFKAERIGPGIFFALFGAAIMVYAIVSPVTLSSSSDTADLAPDAAARRARLTRNYRGAVDIGLPDEFLRNRLKSLVTSEQIARSTGALDNDAKLAQAAIGLESLKAGLVDQILGERRYAEWKRLAGLRPDQTMELETTLQRDPDLARRFTEVEELLTRGF